eukprot:SAG11_NODE_3328_length_2521_cov_6.520231_2_plen_198_part_00
MVRHNTVTRAFNMLPIALQTGLFGVCSEATRLFDAKQKDAESQKRSRIIFKVAAQNQGGNKKDFGVAPKNSVVTVGEAAAGAGKAPPTSVVKEPPMGNKKKNKGKKRLRVQHETPTEAFEKFAITSFATLNSLELPGMSRTGLCMQSICRILRVSINWFVHKGPGEPLLRSTNSNFLRRWYRKLSMTIILYTTVYFV